MKVLANIGASVLLALTFLTGCSGGSKTMVVPDPSATVGLPTPAAAGPVNTYIGAQAPGEWTFTLDDTNGVYSYQPVTYSATATSGTLTKANGFDVLSTGGLALEVEGRAAMLRPGDSTNALVFGVPQTQCYSLTGRLRFQYLDVLDSSYETIVASTNTTGASWAFEDLQGTYASGPASFAATCSTSSNLSTINFTGDSTLLDYHQFGYTFPSSEVQSNIWVGPSGFFVGDQSVALGTTLPGTGGATVTRPYGASVVGIAEPTAAISASAVAAKSYLGFIYEPSIYSAGVLTTNANTFPVSFTGLSGEAFTSNDVTQSLDSTTAMSISLGTQDTSYNGYYPSATMTVLDPAQNCATALALGYATNITAGTNASGYVTCTFPVIALIGNPEGKYALFISGTNWATFQQYIGTQDMNLYLFQQ